MNIRALLGPTLAIAVAGVTLASLSPVASAQNVKERFTGFAINMNSGPSTGVLDFEISRWSTDAERDKLLAIIKENKNPTDKLLTALQKLPKVGWIRSQKTLSWDLHFARQQPLDEGGRQIVLATDRPIGFWEARNQPRSIDYPFTILEMRLDKNDEGTGKILVGTKIYIDKQNNLVLENYSQQPVMFNEIKKIK
jgi:hypothetical protein